MDMTPQLTQQLQLLRHFNDFTESLSNLCSQTTLQNKYSQSEITILQQQLKSIGQSHLYRNQHTQQLPNSTLDN